MSLFGSAQQVRKGTNGDVRERGGDQALSSEKKPVREHRIEGYRIRAYQTLDQREITSIECDECGLKSDGVSPYWSTRKRVSSQTTELNVLVRNAIVVEVTPDEDKILRSMNLSEGFDVSTSIGTAAGRRIGVVEVNPIRNRGGRIERLVAFDLEWNEIANPSRGGERADHIWEATSVLASGDWVKVATSSDGVYQLTYKDLQGYWSNLSPFPSSLLRLYGTAAGMLKMKNSAERPDDLEPISIRVEDGGDGTFGAGDYFLFAGADQVVWELKNDRFRHELNPFADSVYYFINLEGVGQSSRITTITESAAAIVQTSSYDFVDFHEEDISNLIKSGRVWYGEQLGTITELDFGFSVPQIDKSVAVHVRAEYAARSIGVSGVELRLSLPNQGGAADTASVAPVADFYGALYADDGVLDLAVQPRDGDLLTKISLNKGSNLLATAWIDYIEINARRNLTFLDPFMFFRDKESIGAGNVTSFTIQAKAPITIWDVTDPHDVREMVLSGNVQTGFRFKRETSVLREFVCFDGESFLKPRFSKRVPNQDLHAAENVDYLVVAHPSFVGQAEQLANYHETVDGFNTLVITPDQAYNEFSGGAQDITAIKEFIRMLYFEGLESGGRPIRYVLLYGDASYDYKNRISGNSNLVPTHQMYTSLSPTGSIASDDFFGLLDDDEGEAAADYLDIGVGRLPVRSKKEADDVVKKILAYSNSSASFGEWRNVVAFVADDAEPGLVFMRDFENNGKIGLRIDTSTFEIITRKLYLDSYKQQSGSGGERYPEGADAISDQVNKGALMMYYIGHGGELGWAHERILEVPTINKWENLPRMPLFITATCEFSRFDDPRRTSGGEYALLNPNGGGVALLSTTRAVYAGPNLTLTKKFTEQAFNADNVLIPRLGDLVLQTKIQTLDVGEFSQFNSRSFALLGDPALRLAQPVFDAIITEIPDTIRALEKVRISGYVADSNGVKVEGFNGIVYPSVFDKESELQTLSNDGLGPFDYKEWKNVIFRGKASVKNGEFSFEFVAPKDINRKFGIGRVNIYAEGGSIDAHGDFRDFIIGGLSKNPIQDEEGPLVDLFMNDAKFVFGGLTDEHPDLYAEVSDENGINMVGSGIGHDITAVLDNVTSNTIILNDYYEAKIDSYTEGAIRFPFSDLEEGRHSLKLQVWDVNNNPGEAYTEFVVASSEELALEHVLNYPNPFTTKTQFFFEHNKPGQQLDVSIDVFTVAGKLVKSLGGDYFSDGFRVGPIDWNGRDEFDDQLAKGVYLYKVAVKTPTGESVEKFERLVLLR
ncbi:MAG: type IX secretion system sortase PorU [Flavobacteriales bacterium]|nr:type IX secretion system sortase PorU [Flavobacteriales bacterium]